MLLEDGLCTDLGNSRLAVLAMRQEAQGFGKVHTCPLESSSPFTLPRTFPASSRRSLLVSARLQAARLAFHASFAGVLHLPVSQLSLCSFTCR